ncbi:MAG: head-tail adaptor protein [Caulobacteraceae bacterium]|nr:head-tail adaptor protein [Caulobacteraceae bacterium]
MLRNIGTMRHVCDVERSTPGNNAATNEITESWAAIASDVPCHIDSVMGGEVKRGQQMSDVTTHLIEMHHPQGAFTVTPRDRINWTSESLILNVVSVLDTDGRREKLTIQAKANA